MYEWRTGELITAEKLNNTGSGVYIVNYIYGDSYDYLDKTYAEIKSALLDGKDVYVMKDESYNDAEYGYTKYGYHKVIRIVEQTDTGTQTEQHSAYEVGTVHDTFIAETDDGVLITAD